MFLKGDHERLQAGGPFGVAGEDGQLFLTEREAGGPNRIVANDSVGGHYGCFRTTGAAEGQVERRLPLSRIHGIPSTCSKWLEADTRSAPVSMAWAAIQRSLVGMRRPFARSDLLGASPGPDEVVQRRADGIRSLPVLQPRAAAHQPDGGPVERGSIAVGESPNGLGQLVAECSGGQGTSRFRTD